MAVITGNTWALPAGAVPAASDATLEIVARDLADNRAAVTRRLRHDATPPVLTVDATTVRDERSDTVSFTGR